MSLSGVIGGFWAGTCRYYSVVARISVGMVIAQAEFDDGGGEEVTFARNSEVLQNDLSEYYDPIGSWMLA